MVTTFVDRARDGWVRGYKHLCGRNGDHRLGLVPRLGPEARHRPCRPAQKSWGAGGEKGAATAVAHPLRAPRDCGGGPLLLQATKAGAVQAGPRSRGGATAPPRAGAALSLRARGSNPALKRVPPFRHRSVAALPPSPSTL